jgi:hypothetical protein
MRIRGNFAYKFKLIKAKKRPAEPIVIFYAYEEKWSSKTE